MTPKKKRELLDYHEGLSKNQVKIILKEFHLLKYIHQFYSWMHGQTCPIVIRYRKEDGRLEHSGGVYEYDLFQWIRCKIKKVRK